MVVALCYQHHTKHTVVQCWYWSATTPTNIVRVLSTKINLSYVHSCYVDPCLLCIQGYDSMISNLIYCFRGRMSPTDTKSEKSSLTMLTGFSAGTKGKMVTSQVICLCICIKLYVDVQQFFHQLMIVDEIFWFSIET